MEIRQMLAVKPLANCGASVTGNTTTLYQEKKAQPTVIYIKHSWLVSAAKKDGNQKRSAHHSTSGKTLGLVVIFHNNVDEREDHRGHARVETQQEPGRKFQANRNTPDSQTNVTEEQNDAGKGERHPDRVDPVKVPILTGHLQNYHLPCLMQVGWVATHMANCGIRTPTTMAKS